MNTRRSTVGPSDPSTNRIRAELIEALAEALVADIEQSRAGSGPEGETASNAQAGADVTHTPPTSAIMPAEAPGQDQPRRRRPRRGAE
jgi:hypothetical protein